MAARKERLAEKRAAQAEHKKKFVTQQRPREDLDTLIRLLTQAEEAMKKFIHTNTVAGDVVWKGSYFTGPNSEFLTEKYKELSRTAKSLATRIEQRRIAADPHYLHRKRMEQIEREDQARVDELRYAAMFYDVQKLRELEESKPQVDDDVETVRRLAVGLILGADMFIRCYHRRGGAVVPCDCRHDGADRESSTRHDLSDRAKILRDQGKLVVFDAEAKAQQLIGEFMKEAPEFPPVINPFGFGRQLIMGECQ